jgi:NAD(P)H-hydrate epimerase
MNPKIIPSATPGQKQEIDVLMNELGVNTLQMMELAGRDLARLAIKISKGPVLVFCGKGHNGGDGLCAAKHLLNWNVPVAVILVEAEKSLGKEEKAQLKTLKLLNASIFRWGLPDLPKILGQADLVIDALVGHKLNSNPRGNVKKVIEFINKHKKKVLAADIATGIDGLTGENHDPHIRATHTLALGIPLKGSVNNKNSGKLFVSDIGIPDKIYSAIGLETKLRFHKKSIMKL